MIYIIRGLPGSGKKTLAKQLAPMATFIADDFFIGADGVYRFDPTKLPDAHAMCLERFKDQVLRDHYSRDCSNICVANTFVKLEHMQPYINFAKKYEFDYCVIECKGHFKSIFPVPQHTIERMAREWEPYRSLPS